MFQFRSVILGAAIAGVSLSAVGCGPSAGARRATSSGSVALSNDDALLYAADSDNGILAVVDTKSQQKIAEVKLGSNPSRVLVAKDDTIFVANKGSRSVSVVKRGDWTESMRLEVGVEPVAMQASDDGKMLYVISATSKTDASYGTLSAFDLKTMTLAWELRVGQEPRGLAIVNGDRAVIALSRDGQLVEVDLKQQKILGTSEFGASINASGRALGRDYVDSYSTFAARGIADLVASPDGKRIYAPALLAREDKIAKPPNTFGGYYSGGGPCNVGAVATQGLLVADTATTVTPKTDDVTSCFVSGAGTSGLGTDFPPTAINGVTVSDGSSASGGGYPLPYYESGPSAVNPVQGTTAAALDPTGTFLFLVNRETSNVVVLPAGRRDGSSYTKYGGLGYGSTTNARGVADVGAGADGIAISSDGSKAYVYSQFDHRVDVITASGNAVANTGKSISVAADVLPANVVAGRKLFFDAASTKMSATGTNVSCNTCHLEGRDDGHVWGFVDGPRQTPQLAGRKLGATAPYHWSGEFPEFATFMKHTITERMGGAGLDANQTAQLVAYLDTVPAPENPHKLAVPSAAQLRGRAAFEKAQCNNCHVGEAMTNNGFYNVGTMVTSGNQLDDQKALTKGFNVPSLLSLARAAPFLHNGASHSLEERIFSNPNDLHGVTSTLTNEEKADLVEYLKSL